ncbi:MAG TPA: heavy metal-associated domain-containing protein [Bacteroidia bacterium]|nr:heavy-metal-associated domain-containing protein [Bacteroidia bacterium]MBP7715047.1 heavy-metal-associated domain-containing protein [Bacteroidia bacterium]MBP8669091.1 heavy-metal-associated domain-containing protein [Bacteroidia bacterium]HOZ83504.1 heavy metal-associated domain-containing protein [Bacteroidia bacterium]HQW18447.1 heavy metal-associated domain-containing protein [Bacteroidia bacterium]
MKKLIAGAVMLLFFSFSLMAQQNKKAEINIATSAECTMCKKALETALLHQHGVKFAKLDLNTRVVAVKYNGEKVTPETLRQVISNAGYDADSVKANPEAFEKLPDCCKNGALHH